MARKNLLKGLIEDAGRADTDGEVPKSTLNRLETPQKPATGRPMKGAIGAVSQSIEALKARSIIDVDPFLIDPGGLQDRLETDDAEDAALLASIREYGQQVPVLVRPHPTDEGRYQIIGTLSQTPRRGFDDEVCYPLRGLEPPRYRYDKQP